MNDKIRKDEQNMGKKKSLKSSLKGRNLTNGIYASIITAMVILMVLVVNLIIMRLDLRVDLSTDQIFTLTEPTIELLDEVSDDITIYYLAETGSEHQLLVNIAEKYESHSKTIKFEHKDPILYPQFTSQYVEDEVSINSYLIVNNSNGRAKYIDNADLLVKELDYTSFEYTLVGIDVEGQLTSAIQYVTTENLPKLYLTVGHNERELGSVFLELVKKQNVQIEQVATLTSEIPENCDILLIHHPAIDFTEDEVNKIKEYMAAGGNVVTVIDNLRAVTPNFRSLLEYNGIQTVEGILVEGDNSKFYQRENCLVPNVLDQEITSKTKEGGRYVLSINAAGLAEAEVTRSSITLSPLLETSQLAYSKTNLNAQTLYRESGDIGGPFYLGILASDYYKGVTSNMVVYTGSMFEDNQMASFGNGTLLTSTVAYLAGDVSSISVRTRTLAPEMLNVTQQQATFWGALLIIVIPTLIIGSGIVVSLRRRRR